MVDVVEAVFLVVVEVVLTEEVVEVSIDVVFLVVVEDAVVLEVFGAGVAEVVVVCALVVARLTPEVHNTSI